MTRILLILSLSVIVNNGMDTEMWSSLEIGAMVLKMIDME